MTSVGMTRKLGSASSNVFPLALRCTVMSGPYGRYESIATMQAAVDQSVTLLDTGDFYGRGGNEMLIGRARLIVPSWL